MVTAAQRWHLAGTCKPCRSGGWERSRGTHRGVPMYHRASCQGRDEPGDASRAHAQSEEDRVCRTTSVGPFDTEREHGPGSDHPHSLVAPGGPKRRLLQTRSMKWHRLTPQTSRFPLLGPGDTWCLEPHGQSMWQTLPDMLSSLSSHLLPQAAIALANLYLTAKPKRDLSILSPSSGPGQRKSCSLRGLCSSQHAGSRARRNL